jgi:hypothetical protein
MTYVHDSLTLLPLDSLIRVKVRAKNAKGTGQFSEVNTAGATIEMIPTNLMVLSIDMASTTNEQTKVTWTPLTGSSRGGVGVAIKNYEVQWQQPAGAWVSLSNTIDPSDPSYLLKGPTPPEHILVGGTTYKFQVRAINKYGVGPFTNSISVQTSQPPAQPAAPKLEVVGGYVNISWTEPFANYKPVLDYQILIETSVTNTFIERKALCDGAIQAVNKYCLVDMHDLRAAPFGLTSTTLVRAKVLARNERGWSDPSGANTLTTGARIQVEPLAVQAPIRGDTTGPTRLDVSWSSLSTPTENGGSPVLSYHV